MAEDKYYSYSVDDGLNTTGLSSGVAGGSGAVANGVANGPAVLTASNGDLTRQDSSLLSHSDSGGFNSHKHDSVVAVSPNARKDSSSVNVASIQDDLLTNLVPGGGRGHPHHHQPHDVDRLNGNVMYNNHHPLAGSSEPLETMM